MSDKKPSPLRASFILTDAEKRYVLVVCTIFLLGIAARFYYLKNESPKAYVPAGLEQAKESYE